MPRKGNRKSRRSSKKSSGCGMMWGGAGTSDHAIAVYGGIGQQTAQAGGNLIAGKPVGQLGGAPLSPAQFGGAPLSPAQFGGAALSPATIQIGGNADGMMKLPEGIQMGGEGEAVVQEGGTITELAVPAILVLANQSMRRRASSKKRRSFRKRRSNRRR